MVFALVIKNLSKLKLLQSLIVLSPSTVCLHHHPIPPMICVRLLTLHEPKKATATNRTAVLHTVSECGISGGIEFNA